MTFQSTCSILLFAGCAALLAGCASGPEDIAEHASREETYTPTGSLIARRNVDRASPVKTASKEEMENARIMGGNALNLPQN
jgi:hypothetical protein